MAALLVLLASCALGACHPAEVIVTTDLTWGPVGTSYNGYKVFLSSPRHASSGSRGECRSPGWEENVNGRAWNYYAATGTYANDIYNPGSSSRSFRSRGYQVTVSKNTRDDGFGANRIASNNWGANIHLVSHTNAVSHCGENIRRTIGMYQSGDTSVGQPLAERIALFIDNVAPGNRQVICRGVGCPQGGLDELSALAHWTVYMELIFHTDQVSQSWFHGTGSANKGAQRYAWRYGYAIDVELGFP